MTGREVSVLSFVDGKTIKTMTSAQDHKRAQDDDQGLSTGGKGTFSPSPFYTPEIAAFCEENIYKPTMAAMKAADKFNSGNFAYCFAFNLRFNVINLGIHCADNSYHNGISPK